MKKFTYALIAVLSSALISCDNKLLVDDVNFGDLLGTWGIVSYHVEGRPAAIPPDTRVSFYYDFFNYNYVAISNDNDGNGEEGPVSFNREANELTFAGNTCEVETLNETTFTIRYYNNMNRRCEMTYSRVYPPQQNPLERQLSGFWEQHYDIPGDFLNPYPAKGDFYLTLYPNGDFVDMGSYTESGKSEEYARFGHYTISNGFINVYFGERMEQIPIVSYTSNTLTLRFGNEIATYIRYVVQ